MDADLTGDLGDVSAQGYVTLLPPQLGRRRTCGSASPGSTSRRSAGGKLPTSLAGELHATGSIDTLRAPEGELELALGRSRVREWTIDSLFGRGGVHDSVIRVDTAYAEWQGARAAGAGTLGWARAARRPDAVRSRGRQPHRVRLAAAGRHEAEAGHLGRGAAARRSRRSAGWSWRAASTRCRRRRPRGVRLRVAAHPLAPDDRQPHLARRAAAARRRRAPAPTPSGCGSWLLTPRRRGRETASADSLAWSGGTDAGRGLALRRGGAVVRRRATPGSSGWTRCSPSSPCAATGWSEPSSMALADSAPSVSPADAERAGRLRASSQAAGTRPGQGARRARGAAARPRPARSLRPASARHARRRAARWSSTCRSAGRPRRADVPRHRAGWPTAGSATSRPRSSRACSTTQTAGSTRTWTSGAPAKTCSGRGAPAAGPRAHAASRSGRLDGPLSVRAHADSVALGLLEAITPAVDRVGGTLKA